MRNVLKFTAATAFALAVCGASGTTGADAAALITDDPRYVDKAYQPPEQYQAEFQYYDPDGNVSVMSFPVNEATDADTVAAWFQYFNIWSAEEAMLNAMRALVETTVLSAKVELLGKRIDAVVASANDAVKKIDRTKVVDEHGNKIESILKIINNDSGGSDVEVTTEGVPADRISLDYTGVPTGPNKPAPLEIKGFGAASHNRANLPHSDGSALAWDHAISLFDPFTMSARTVPNGAFGVQIGLKGWDTPTADSVKCDDALSSQLLTGDETHHVVTRLNNGTLHYTPVGKLSVMSPDDSTITTNAANGATETGKASLYGYNLDATGSGYIPSKGGDGGALTWLNPADMVDGTSLAQATTGSGKKVWEVKDAHSYAGTQARHYFGTGDDSALGWHELPNVTTNNVVGDEKTISSTFDQTGETKIFGLKGFPTSGTLLALACQGGDLLYIPFPAGGGTNLVAVDDVSVSSNTTGRLQLHGWETQGACSEKAAEILAGGEATAQSKHEIVTRYGGAGGSIHYLPFDVFPHPNTDDFTIDPGTKAFSIKGEDGKYLCGTAQGGVEWMPTNGVDRASIVLTDGIASLNGFANAEPDMVAFKDSSGNLAWRLQPPLLVDGVSVASNAENRLEVGGFAVAPPGTVPTRTQGGITWLPSGGGAATRLVGTDGSFVVLGSGLTTNSVTFASETNANVTVWIAAAGNGGATVKIGVYWR